jgi:hypothetical protein
MVQAERSDGLVFPNGNPKKIDWPADLPACDICGKPAPFDVPTAGSGRWANLCPDHAPEFGAQTGIGFERVKPGMGDRSPSERMDAATREMLTAAGLTEEDMDLFDGDLIDMDFVQADNPDGSMQSGPTIQVVLPEAAALFYDGPNYGGDATLQAKLDAAPRRRRGRGEAIVVNLTEAELNDLERSFRTESSGRNVDSEFLGSRSRILDQIGDYQNDFERMKSGGVARFQIRPGADLSGKNMSGTMIAARANLTGANLSGANFERATLTKAKLRNANLTGANLNRAMLWQADLRGADLRGADLTGATLDEVIYDDTTVWPEGFTPPEQSIDMVQADNPMAENADTFDLAMNFNRYGREEVAERLGVDPDNVSRPTSLGDLQEMMGDDVSAAEARAFVDRLTERGLMEWINDRDGGLMWADENQYMTELSATDGMAEDLRLSTVSLGTSTALNYLRTRFPNLGRPGWNTTGRPDREVVAELVAEAFSDKGLDVGFLDDAVAEVMRVLAQSG